jgi:hypothetical protein
MAKAILRAATFRPAEIQKITGIAPDNLRDLRKRGYVEETEGWTAATLLQTARLIIMSRLSAVEIPPAASWEIARLEGAAEQVVAYALAFEGAVVDHTGRAVKTTGLHLGNELPPWKLPLASAKRRRFLCIYDWKSEKAFFTNDAKKIYFTQREIPLLALDLKAYGSLLFDKAGKPLIQIQDDG